MKLRTLVVTVLVLAALSAVAYFARRPAAPSSADARLDQPLVDRATVEKATKIQINDAGKSVELVRQTDGTWRVPSYYDLPVDFSKLSTFVSNLTDAKLQRLVTTTPERIARLEFKDTKIQLLDGTGKDIWSATLGKNAETGGRYVRFGTEQKAYLANLNAFLDAEPKNWADPQLLNLKTDEIAKLEVPFDSAPPLVITRAKKDDAWTAGEIPAGQKLKTEKISSVLSSLGSIRFTDTSELNDPKATAAQQHLRPFKLTTFDGKTYTVALGRKPEEKKLKPPAPGSVEKSGASAVPSAKEGPAALGSVTDLKKGESEKSAKEKSPEEPKSEEKKPLVPEFETIPAGPVFVFITSSDASSPINTEMKKRAFQVSEYTFTGLPQNAAEFFELAPPPPAAPSEKGPGKAEPKK